jgi:DNA-directed RNA polymerase subunit RPC12/RpoP
MAGDTQLLLCPFCGGQASFESNVSDSVVRCTSCTARVVASIRPEPGVSISHEAMKQSEDQSAVEMWNARSESQDRRTAETRAAALEEAAKMVEQMPRLRQVSTEHVKSNGPADCAAAIRALIPEREG